MRSEERGVSGGGASVSGGEGKVSVRNYSHTTNFGWVFPRVETRRRGVTDEDWLRDFASDIQALQCEITRQTTRIYSDKEQKQSRRDLRECCAVAMSCKQRLGALSVTSSEILDKSVSEYESDSSDFIGKDLVNSESDLESSYSDQRHVELKMNRPERACASKCESESSDDVCKDLANSESDLEASYASQGHVRVKVQQSENSGSEKPLILDSSFNACTVNGKCDEFSSMVSDISRDSGVFSIDSYSVASEGSGDKSLLQELGDVLGDQNVSLEPCIHCGSLPYESSTPSKKNTTSCPVWMSRFSNLTEWGSEEWEDGQSVESYPFKCISPARKRESSASEGSERHLASPSEGVEVKEYVVSDKRNEESRISELSKFTQSFQNLSTRIQDLRSGLQCLAREVNESKRDFLSLEERTTKLVSSTVISRHRMTRVRALQLLEDRLQEEWWGVYDPNSVTIHENYIV